MGIESCAHPAVPGMECVIKDACMLTMAAPPRFEDEEDYEEGDDDDDDEEEEDEEADEEDGDEAADAAAKPGKSLNDNNIKLPLLARPY